MRWNLWLIPQLTVSKMTFFSSISIVAGRTSIGKLSYKEKKRERNNKKAQAMVQMKANKNKLTFYLKGKTQQELMLAKQELQPQLLATFRPNQLSFFALKYKKKEKSSFPNAQIDCKVFVIKQMSRKLQR